MEGNTMWKSMNPMVAYQKGLTTWAKWVDLNLDPQKTRVIFRSVSPRHNRYHPTTPSYLICQTQNSGRESLIWEGFACTCRQNGWRCHNQKQPLEFFAHQPHVPEQLVVLKGVLKEMRFPVYLQDITIMAALRKDGHPSVYTRAMDQEQKQHPRDFTSDCSHWCLPGVPDAWNEMLSALLLAWMINIFVASSMWVEQRLSCLAFFRFIFFCLFFFFWVFWLRSSCSACDLISKSI